MSKLFIILIAMGLMISCSKDSTGPDNTDPQAESFKSVNVKTEGKQYFSFSTNEGTLTEPAAYDIAFGVAPLTVETAPCQFFTMGNDPVIFTGSETAIAKVNAASLADVTEIPDTSAFAKDDLAGDAFIGKKWFDAQYAVKPDVYVIKTCAGNFGLLDIKRYDMDFEKMEIKNIVWDFKYNSDGSTNFSSAVIDSFATSNAYDETRYFSFSKGAITADDTYDIKVLGSSIWLGENVTIKKLADTELANVNTVTDSDLSADVQPSYVTLGWYNYGDGHKITPKDFVYVVKTADGKYPAFEVISYYDDMGESGTYTISWKYLNP
jgi:hypothetical protein